VVLKYNPLVPYVDTRSALVVNGVACASAFIASSQRNQAGTMTKLLMGKAMSTFKELRPRLPALEIVR
jgi:hypothetical protein